MACGHCYAGGGRTTTQYKQFDMVELHDETYLKYEVTHDRTRARVTRIVMSNSVEMGSAECAVDRKMRNSDLVFKLNNLLMRA